MNGYDPGNPLSSAPRTPVRKDSGGSAVENAPDRNKLPLILKEKLAEEIARAQKLTLPEKQALLSVLDTLPDRQMLCHNDFHPGNIMIADGRYLVIDRLTAASGDPAADVARSLLLLRFGEPADIGMAKRILVRLGKKLLTASYLRRYLKESGITVNEIRRWMLPVAAARLSEGLTEHEQMQLMRFIRKENAK